MLTIERLIELKGVIKWNAVFGEAGLNPNTMRSAVHHQRELRAEEAEALVGVLKKHGVRLTTDPATQGFRSQSESLAHVRERSPEYPHASHD